MKYILSLILCCTVLAQQTVNNFAVKTNLTVAGAGVTLEVDSIANLLTLAAPPIGSVAQSTGYYSSGDGGGGAFRLVPASSGSTNLGTFFASLANPTVAWQRINDGSTFDIRWFGAVSGGVTNCRNALQSAINSAYAAGGGTVVIPQGDYRITAPFIEFLPGVNLRGDGGVLWYSLPDSYNRSADMALGYGVPRAVVLTDPWINSYGVMVNGFTNATYTTPWNGKGQVFMSVTNSVFQNVVFDGGWGSNAWRTRPSGVIPIVGVSSAAGGGGSDEFTYYQVLSQVDNSKFYGCTFYNSPGACFSRVSYSVISDCFFSDYGDHILYIRPSFFSTAANSVTFADNIVQATRTTVGSAGTYPYIVSPPSTNYVSATIRDAIKIQNANGITVSGNTVNTIDAVFLTLEAYPRTDNTSTNSYIDIEDVQIIGNVFSGNRFATIRTSRRDNAGNVVSIYNLPEGQKIRNTAFSYNTAVLIAATNWNGGGAKFFGTTEVPVYGQDYGAALASVKIDGNIVSGPVSFQLFGNPEYSVGYTNVVIQQNNISTSLGGGLFQIAGRTDQILFNGNFLINSNAQNDGSPSILRSFGTGMIYDGVLTFRNNTAINYTSWLFENLSTATAAYNNALTYTYSTTAFSDFTLTNRSIARTASGSIYWNNVTTTGGGDPTTNANWSPLTYPTLTIALSDNYKKMVSTNGTTSTERCGLLTYFYSPASQEMKYTALVNHVGNVNVGLYGDVSAYGLSSPPDAALHVINDKPIFDIVSPLEPMGYVNATSKRIGFGYNFTTPATTFDVQANEILFGADNGVPDARTINTIKTARLNFPSFTATSSSAGTRVSGIEFQTATNYNSFTIGSYSSGLYLPTIFEVRLATTTTTSGNTASRHAIYADGSLRVAINGTTFAGSEKLNVNGPAVVSGSLQATTLELGNATDTTFARVSAGVASIEGNTIITSTTIRSGSGSPEGVVTAPVGTLYLNSTGGAGTTLYVKESGTGNTGWVGK